MKKAIVLLISLLFIVAISALIVKNMDSSEKILKNANVNTSLIQLQRGITNINNEVIKLFHKYRNNINEDEFWEKIPASLPLSYGKINAVLNVSLYDPEDYLPFDKNLTKKIRQYHPQIYLDEFTLNRFIAEHNITNKKQIDFVVDKYIEYVKDDKILELDELFVAQDLPTSVRENNETNNTIDKDYVKVNYTLQIDTLEAKVNMVFDVDSKEKKIYDISLQRLE
jgi:hypothetical protein